MGVSQTSSSSSSAKLFGIFPFTFISAVSMGKSMAITLILVVSLSLFSFHVSSAKRTILIGDRRMLPSCTDCRRHTPDPTCCKMPPHSLSPLMEQKSVEHLSPDEESKEHLSPDEKSA